MAKRVCTVRGKDFRGYPIFILVEAYSVFEAAARAMEQIRVDGGAASELSVTMHEPKKEWKVSPGQLLKYASKHGSNENVGLRTIKQNVRDFLDPLKR